MEVLRGTSCVTRSTVLVLWCVQGGGQGSLWLTAPCYNYALTLKPEFLPNTFTPRVIILCSFPLLTVVAHSQLDPPLTCFPSAGVIANTVSAGKPNRAWHSTPSPGQMRSWCHKYPAAGTTSPPFSRHVSGTGEPWAGVCVTFFGGWVVTGHVFKTPLHVVKLNQTMQHRSWMWMGGCVSEQATLWASMTRSTLADRAFMVEVSPSGWLVPLASGVRGD